MGKVLKYIPRLKRVYFPPTLKNVGNKREGRLDRHLLENLRKCHGFNGRISLRAFPRLTKGLRTGKLNAKKKMLRAFVPSFTQVQQDQGKQFTVYKIVVLQSSKRHEIERRYSAFHALHKQLKGMHPTPYFPPKRVRNFSPKFLEQRRQGLEHYLQGALTIRPVPQSLLNFLNLSSLSPAVSYTSLDAEETDLTINHQPVLTFGKNSFVEIKRGNLPDIISQGVLHGLYSDDKLIDCESQDN